ncbi:MAG TPA: SigE family RNA polymerase sigma factor [Acidimicrobiales bacterium]
MDVGSATLAPTVVADLETSDAVTARLFRERYSELVGLAGLLLNDRGAAEEVVQDAFAKFHLSRHRIHDPDREVAYLRSIVCNLARGRIRRWALERRKRPEPAPEADHRHDVAEDRHRRDVVAAALAGLPRRQRECVVLRYWLDLAVRDIAEALDIAEGSVKSHLHRGLAALETRLEALR